MHHKGYILPTFSRWDGVGSFHYCEGSLYSARSNIHYWLDEKFERVPEGKIWKLPRPFNFIPPIGVDVAIIGKGPVGDLPTSGLLIGINHWPEPQGESKVICIMQDFQKPVYRKDALTLISDELIPLFNLDLYPKAGPVAMIPAELQGKDPTALVACKLFKDVTLFGFSGVFAEDAPDHYKIQREGLAPYMR